MKINCELREFRPAFGGGYYIICIKCCDLDVHTKSIFENIPARRANNKGEFLWVGPNKNYPVVFIGKIHLCKKDATLMFESPRVAIGTLPKDCLNIWIEPEPYFVDLYNYLDQEEFSIDKPEDLYKIYNRIAMLNECYDM